MPKPGEGPMSQKDAKAKAKAILEDTTHHGERPEHAASQRLERLDDPGKQKTPNVGPEWKEVGDTWVHDTEG